MIEAAKVLAVPILVTEQNPDRLGPTVVELSNKLEGIRPVPKMQFSACVESIVNQLNELHRPHVLVVGVETHVCVQQTVLDLLELGFKPVVCKGAVTSRRGSDRRCAERLMHDAGAIVTSVESVIFEMLRTAEHDKFKDILRIVK
jgi:nicotinamidase-related amidase